jgi:hypothetical protein
VKRVSSTRQRGGLSLIASLLTLYALLGSFGCAIPQVPYRSVYEDPVNYVRLELDDQVLPEWPPTAHTHPKAMTADEVARLLNGMTVQEHRIWLQKWIQGEAPFEPVFRSEEVTLLSQQLAEALATAKENERVTFYLSQPQTSVKRVITSGGLYVQGTEVHFILGNWQIIYGIPTYGMIYDRRYPMRPTAPKGFDLFFQPPMRSSRIGTVSGIRCWRIPPTNSSSIWQNFRAQWRSHRLLSDRGSISS